jgi:hypothetical protein
MDKNGTHPMRMSPEAFRLKWRMSGLIEKINNTGRTLRESRHRNCLVDTPAVLTPFTYTGCMETSYPD